MRRVGKRPGGIAVGVAVLAAAFVCGFDARADSPVGTTFVVNTTDTVRDGVCDQAHCSLFDARDAADANPGKDTIKFAIPGPAPHVIQPSNGFEFREPIDIVGSVPDPGSPPAPTVVI